MNHKNKRNAEENTLHVGKIRLDSVHVNIVKGHCQSNSQLAQKIVTTCISGSIGWCSGLQWMWYLRPSGLYNIGNSTGSWFCNVILCCLKRTLPLSTVTCFTICVIKMLVCVWGGGGGAGGGSYCIFIQPCRTFISFVFWNTLIDWTVLEL